MLLEFKVANFRSIRDEQTLSFIAAADSQELPGNLLSPNLSGMNGIRLLKAVAIYGANASGKSNVLLALRFLAQFAGSSFTKLQPDASTGTRSFRLEASFEQQPTTFEVTAIVQGERYTYGLSLNSSRVTEEYLVAFPDGKAQICFERKWDEGTDHYRWSPPNDFFRFDGAILEATRDNCSFVSAGGQFKHPILAPIQRWFTRRSSLISSIPSLAMRENTARACVKAGEPVRAAVLAFMQRADLGIRDLIVEELADPDDAAEGADVGSDTIVRRQRPGQRYNIKFEHRSRDGLSKLPYLDQSSGTKRYFGLAAAWIEHLLSGGMILMDEIETSLHPILVRELIKLVFDERANCENAQLLFTTHNPLLLDRTLLRTDQIWFTEKDDTGATTIYPLTDYQQRPKEPLVNGYLAGRYGGVPFIPSGLLPKLK